MSSVIAVGLDLVDIERVEKMIARHGDRVLRRLLTEEERQYCLSKAVPARHIAARIAAKEAAYKALSQGGTDRVVWWQDVELQRDGKGRPTVSFKGRAGESAVDLGVTSSLVSISHSENSAAAVVLLLC